MGEEAAIKQITLIKTEYTFKMEYKQYSNMGIRRSLIIDHWLISDYAKTGFGVQENRIQQSIVHSTLC